MDITLDHVTHTYMKGTPFERIALYDVSMHIPTGSLIGIIGHTGSGKSTLIQHFNGLLRPTEGTVKVGSTIISKNKSDLRKLRQRVGMVFQYPEHQLFEETVMKDVAFGPNNYDLPEDVVNVRVKHALSLVGMDHETWGARSPFELSGGQMRRVAIAGVIAMQPDVLILDEPTAGLDPQGRIAILELISTLHKEQGMTIILVTHNMEDAARYADQLYVMGEGRIALSGPPKDVFGHHETLTSLGLDIPDITRFIMKLNERLAQPLPYDIFHMDTLANVLTARVKAKGGSET